MIYVLLLQRFFMLIPQRLSHNKASNVSILPFCHFQLIHSCIPEVKQSKKDERTRKKRRGSSSYCASCLFCICDWANNWGQMVLCYRQLTENHCWGMWTEHALEAATKLRQEKVHESLSKNATTAETRQQQSYQTSTESLQTNRPDLMVMQYYLNYLMIVTWSSGFWSVDCWYIPGSYSS